MTLKKVGWIISLTNESNETFTAITVKSKTKPPVYKLEKVFLTKVSIFRITHPINLIGCGQSGGSPSNQSIPTATTISIMVSVSIRTKSYLLQPNPCVFQHVRRDCHMLCLFELQIFHPVLSHQVLFFFSMC